MLTKSNLNLSLSSQSLKYKLKIAFYLMSVLPLLVTAYLVSSYILPHSGFKIDVVLSTIISAFIALIGFFVIKEVFDRIVSVTTVAKLIAAGDVNRKLETAEGDEIGDLSDALNNLTRRIRDNMDELKSYGDKTNQINMEIQKRVLVLSSLLQISSLITQGVKVEEVLAVIVEKARLLANSDVAYILLREAGKDNFAMKIADGINSNYLLDMKVDLNDEIFSNAILKNESLVIDKSKFFPENLKQKFYLKFKLKNTMVIPIFLRGKVTAMLGIGNSRESFVYPKDEIELLDIFSKQAAIAVENDLLTTKIVKLEIKDALTGLYNKSFITMRLREEIKRAIIYQRPCAFVLLDIDNLKKFHEKFGYLETETQIKKISTILRESVGEVDRVGRIGDDEFGIIFPEKNKRQAQELAEVIRKKVEFSYSEESDDRRRLAVSGGVSENPLDGIESEELIAKAQELLQIAKQQGKNRIVGLKEPPLCQ